jgi:hypothetical protein
MDFSNINLGDSIDTTTIVQSEIRNQQIESVMDQHFGTKWKIAVFLIVLFVFGCVVLVIYGINFDNTTPNITTSQSTVSKVFSVISTKLKPHIKVFLIILIISILFFCIWTVIKPGVPDTKLQGVVPYPTDHPLIPPDNTICGTSIVNCTQNNDCSQCKELSGVNKYICTPIKKDQQVYYEGSPLKSGQSYCLPRVANNTIQGCSTYTGKVVYTSGEEGEGWQCQCLYPTIFNDFSSDPTTETCTTQQVCKYTDKTENIQHTLLSNQSFPINGKTNLNWDPSNFPSELVGTTPYDLDSKGNAIFTCSQPPIGNDIYNVYPGDPFNLHRDNCWAGDATAPQGVGIFDTNSMECVCDGGTSNTWPPDPKKYNANRHLFKSNGSGYCYPYDVGNTKSNCSPHYMSGLCTFDFDPANYQILFSSGGQTYVPYVYNTNGMKFTCLINVTGQPSVPSNALNIDSTAAKDLFLPFPKYNYGNLSASQQGDVNTIIQKAVSQNDKTTSLLNQAISDMQTVSTNSKMGYAQQCNSYFYKNGDNFPQCYDPLNKTGVQFIQIGLDPNGKPVCGEGDTSGVFSPNISNSWDSSDPNNLEKFYSCNCIDNTIFREGKCIQCLPNDTVVDKNREIVCCSGHAVRWCHTCGAGNAQYECNPYYKCGDPSEPDDNDC